MVTENSIQLNIKQPKKDVHKRMEVFYNPLMESNRNISVLLINSLPNEKMNIALPLAGSGIRGLRFLKELDKKKINHLFVNDKRKDFTKSLKRTLSANKIKSKKLSINNEEASFFLLNQLNNKKKPKGFCGYFDYIDIDPFGTPNPFLSASVGRIARKGVIAVTATDTAALSGTYPKVTQRKYWSRNLRTYLMHEIGLRILIRKVQLQGVQYDKVLTPILSYHKDHYYRIYFVASKGKVKCDDLLNQHQYLLFNPKTLEFKTSKYNNEKGFDYFGPMWVGDMKDQKLLTKMVKGNPFPKEQKFLETLMNEKDSVGFYDLNVLGKKYKFQTPNMDKTLKKLKGTRTHLIGSGVKTDKSLKDVMKVLKK